MTPSAAHGAKAATGRPARANPSFVLAAALAEMRSARRLVRTWLFTAIAVGVPLIIFVSRAAHHGTYGAFDPMDAMAGPRYAMPMVGLVALLAFLVCTVFLAFDVRARDQRDRLADVLDARPASNTTLLGARLAGIVATVWAPAALLVTLMHALGWAGVTFDLPLAPPEPLSTIRFLFVDLLPLAVFFAALVMCLAIVLRNRWLVAVAALALLVAWLWSLGNVSLHHARPLLGHAALVFNSDILPRVADAPALLHRAALLVAAAGLVALAAAAHPRPDAGRTRRTAAGAGLLLLGAAGIGGLAWQAHGDRADVEGWWQAHMAAQERNGARPDIEHMEGKVDIAPGDALTLDIALRVRPTGTGPLLFSLNPGLAISSLQVDGAPAAFEHQSGLLTVTAPPARGEPVLMALRAHGRPSTRFAYLDAILRPQDRLIVDETTMLGLEAAVFDARYVALMPAIGWLPLAGANVGLDDPGRAPRDFFTLDLEVDAPAGWVVAGPGRRHAVAGAPSDRARYRFNPSAPLPPFALIASRFERRATEVAGVTLEILLSPKHTRNLDFLADATEPLAARLTELLGDASQAGLAYPYGAFALVEVPATLRGYGGGWRLDTVRALPGMVLMREQGFPTAVLDAKFKGEMRLEDAPGGVAAAKLKVVEGYFGADLTGGALLTGAARNLVLFQTGAQTSAQPADDAPADGGMAAAALEMVAHELATLLLAGRGSYFSAYLFSDAVSWERVASFNPDLGGVRSTLHAVASRPAVWDRALGAPLATLDPHEEPGIALNVLAYKGRAVARTLLDTLGRQGAAALLATLRSRHSGGHFNLADFNAAGRAIGADLPALLGDWLHDTALPGFLASPVTVTRIADDGRGRPRYQTRVHIRNGEPAPGLLRLRYRTRGAWRRERWQDTRPVRIAGDAAVEVGLVTRGPPVELRMAPYLALNRVPVDLPLPAVRHDRVDAAAEPFVGQRPSDWRPRAVAGIVVDDLDPGFAVEHDEVESNGLRLGDRIGRTPPGLFDFERDLDQGLPEHRIFEVTPAWTRQALGTSWGKYRRTLARTLPGDGRRRAVFGAHLPHAGTWRVAYHMPRPQRPPWMRKKRRRTAFEDQGVYDITVAFGDERRTVEFDGTAAEVGWNELGAFRLPAGLVRVLVSNRTDGALVVADAVWWRQAANTGALTAAALPEGPSERASAASETASSASG